MVEKNKKMVLEKNPSINFIANAMNLIDVNLILLVQVVIIDKYLMIAVININTLVLNI